MLISGTVLMWRGSAQQPKLLAPPPPRLAAAVTPAMPVTLAPIGEAPSADPKTREENASGAPTRMTTGESRWPDWSRHCGEAYAQFDLDLDGKLSFEEWAVQTIDKYKDANADGDGSLSPAEYASTAPKPKSKKPACACG